ncbi:Ig-like domain-containing protein [Caballeronia sordidicola]|uniref:Ig-like domain-containing protein n=1 Tax=Caballeronia sordidicola TaxID=196367 RepID=UPI0004D01477|nr:Ig-like domain-containing protein [Caballeronia sordidicola]
MALQANDSHRAIIVSVGQATGGGIADSTRPIINGTADAGTIVNVFDGVRMIGSTTVSADGSWAFEPSADLKVGVHQFTAISMDSQGDYGASSTPVSVTVTLATLEAPVVTALANDRDATIPAGGTTAISQPTATGTGKPGDTVTLFDGVHVIGSGVVDSTGKWSIELVTKLVDGQHDVYAIETNAAGAHSPESDHTTFTLDTTTPAVPVVLGVMDNVGPIQGLLHFSSWTDDARPTVFGTGHPGDIITLIESRLGSIRSAVVASDGTWSVRPEVALRDGMQAFEVTATNKAGTTGDMSITATVLLIDTSTPSAPSITSVMDNTGSVTGPIPAGGTTDETRPVISGSGQPGHIVKLYDGTTLVGSSEVSGGGQWTVQPADPMTATVHNLSAVEFTKAGVAGAPSAYFLFLIETPVLKSVMHVSETGDHSDAASVTGHEVVADPAQSSTHAAAPGETASVLHVTSDHGMIDLASLAAKPVAAKASGADAIDVTAQHAVLKLSLVDVLNAGEQDLFQKDGKQQLVVNGKEGDTVDLSNSHVAGLAEGEWQNHGTAQVSGVTYNVYEHSGAHAELLVQQGTQIVLH